MSTLEEDAVSNTQDVQYPAFNYEFLVFLLIASVISILFLLYLNRIFASVISYGIRTWTWRKHRVYIDIGALQISLLGGRIFFTNIRYHGSNETFFIQQGYVTWRYWLRRVREAEIHVNGKSMTKEKNAKLPCRINVDLIGVEWFVYNRSPAYDSIIAGLSESAAPSSSSNDWAANRGDAQEGLRARQSKSDIVSEKSGNAFIPPTSNQTNGFSSQQEKGPNNNDSHDQLASDSYERSMADSEVTQEKTPDLPFILSFFPIHIDCQKVAAVIGNDNTKGILIFRSDAASADIDATETETVDPYRQVFNVEIKRPMLEIRENEDYKGDQSSRATGDTQNARAHHKPNAIRRQVKRLLRLLRRLIFLCPGARGGSVSPESRNVTGTSASNVPGSQHWQGLSRYLDEQEQDDRARWSSVEYAAETSILDCPSATMTMYWDAVSQVTAHARRHETQDSSTYINGEEAPAWGMHFTIRGGVVNYGPWADRRRADLQRVFFPYLCKDATPADSLPVGAWRVPTKFKVFIEIEETVTLRVPFREESKNWRWRGREPQFKQFRPRRRRTAKKDSKGETASIRPSAWLEVKVAPNATVGYSMDMLASSKGYSNKINIELPGTELRSVVNQDILWRSGSQRISCDLSNPLSWNSPRLWKFDIDSDNLKLFILRDHIFLLIDLINDWTSGPPSQYLLFTPFKYLMNLKLRNLQLYLNINDANIIDNPTAMDDNAYLILSSPLLKAETSIPIESYCPEKSLIPFQVQAETLDLAFHAPQWNTQSAFKFSNEIGQIGGLDVSGQYHYNATTSPANTDTLVLTVSGNSPHAVVHGYVVRAVLLLKDNYFGDFVHFRTLDEYQGQLQLKQQNPDAELDSTPPAKKSNDLDIILSIKTTNARVMLPTNMYTASRYVQAELASLAVDLRFTNYYMDLDLDLSPLHLSLGNPEADLDSPNDGFSNTQLFVDGVRVYGHRLFGLPPVEPTYLCNWDVSVGAVSGDCTTDFLSALANAAVAFDFTFDDVENALTPYSSITFDDVTFAQVAVESIKIWLHVDEAAFLFSTDTIDITSNDWARSHYSKRANISIPNVQFSCVNSESAARQKSRPTHPIETYAYFKTDVRLASIGRKTHFTEKRRLQQELVQREDQRTNRTPFLLIPEYLDKFFPEPVDPPAQPAPLPPQPLVEVETDYHSLNSGSASHRSNRLKRQSSFLSLSGSSSRSIRRTKSHTGLDSKSIHSVVDSLQAAKPRPSFVKSDASTSSGHLSNFYSIRGDDTTIENFARQSVVISSQYFEPHFALKDVEPDKGEVPWCFPETAGDDDFLGKTAAELSDIDPHGISEEHTYSSVLLEFPTGLSGFFSPSAIRYTASLASALHPTDPEDVLDCLQANAVSKILDLKKRGDSKGSISDLLVRIPQANVRFLNSSTLDSPDPAQQELDQYDLSISKFGLVTRTVTDWNNKTHLAPDDSRTSLHLRLGSAEISASERLSSLQEPQAAMMIQIEHVIVSVGAKEVTYFDADVGSIVGSTASGKIEYLAALIHRTGSLATELEHRIQGTLGHHENRLKYFMYRLLEEGHSTNDPSFLIRPSAVLRSAPEHLRTFDSWKLAMRLRQIWSTMEAQTRQAFNEDFHNLGHEVPGNAAERVVAAFQHWRSWDLGNVSNAILIQNVFGSMAENPKSESTLHPILGACRLGELQLVLDPGPKENKVGIVDVTIRSEKKTPTKDLLPGTSFPKGPLTVITLQCSEAALNMNWELCELVEDILRLYNRNKSMSDKPARKPHKKESAASGPSAFHVVVEVIRGSVELETVNLKMKSLSHGITNSVLFHSDGKGSNSTSLLLNCDDFTSDLNSHTQLLSVFRLQNPSVFVSHDMQETDSAKAQIIKSAASSRSLQLSIKQEPITLLEVVDLLLRDEVSQVLRLQKQLPSKPKPSKSVRFRDHLSSFRFNLNLFLDRYTVTIPLLQSLTYKISGVVARAACAANFGKEIIFDFDIKENSHEMQIDVKKQPRTISLLQIPPINGRITSQIHNSEHVVTVLSSLELMQLDASAIYSLLAALNRPQISSAIEEIQEQVRLIQHHITDTFGPKGSEPSKEETGGNGSKLDLVYSVHMTMAGLRVSAVTPLNSQSTPAAQVLFFQDKFHLQASNRHESQGPILRYPELHLNVKQFGFDIRRGQRDAMRSCGSFGAGVTVSASSRLDEDGKEKWSFGFRCPDLTINLSPETISTAVGVLGYLRGKIQDLDTSRELDYLRKLRKSKPRITLNDGDAVDENESDILESVLGVLVYNFELQNIRICWIVVNDEQDKTISDKKEDLVLSIKLIQFGTRTIKSARLTIENFQLQTVPQGQDKSMRSLHSALLPEIIFNMAMSSTPTARRMAFQATGQSLDLRLTSGFIVPAANLASSLSLSARNIQNAYDEWGPGPDTSKKQPYQAETTPEMRPWSVFGKKRLESLLVDAAFDGAVVHISSKRTFSDASRSSKPNRPSLAGKYGQFNTDDTGSGAVLRSPGLAWKVELRDNGYDDPTLSGEIMVQASSNTLYPSVVPLIMDMVSSVKEVVSDDTENATPPSPEKQLVVKHKTERLGEEENILTADPSAVLGRMKLNLGLRICKQEFSLSCQPIARVAATACFDSIYFTANTVSSPEHGNFFAISATVRNLQTTVQHVYSRESTGSFEIETITLSFMNSKHVSGTSGVSAILNVSSMKVSVNAKQVQDFLLFREIWYPEELRRGDSPRVAKLVTETSQGHLVQRYQQVAATAAFPWTATISITSLDVSVDLGQTIGKSVFEIANFWVSSKKTSDWEQNLCLGFSKIGVNCTGRLSGFVALQDFKLRTSIQWPKREEALSETPLVQASLGFNAFRMKAAFDYQAFLIADITSLEFLMYNKRDNGLGRGDRLVAIFDGEAVQVFGTTTSTAQAVALYQAIKKLIQERRGNFEASLRDIEKFMRRKTSAAVRFTPQASDLEPVKPAREHTLSKSPFALDTDVVVTLKALNLGVFPSTFSDHQVFKMEAMNAYARFTVGVEHGRIHSLLKMTLGQLRIGLAGVRNVEGPKTLNEISVDDVVERVTGSRGGTILRVPRVSAMMETWQTPDSNTIDYIFKSAFEGKVEVGWNYSRISYIRGMFANHSKALQQTWGRELSMAAVKITGVPLESKDQNQPGQQQSQQQEQQQQQQQQKITAEVHVPQSKYSYVALEPAIIETPQLRDMGEATPPLEWIGLHRDRLPNLTHQIVIVSLLELAGEVEDAYSRILGVS